MCLTTQIKHSERGGAAGRNIKTLPGVRAWGSLLELVLLGLLVVFSVLGESIKQMVDDLS